MAGSASGGDATEQSPRGTGRKLFSLNNVGFTQFPEVASLKDILTFRTEVHKMMSAQF
jgi:hypothetical protein